jgi:hypothetical protein
VWEPYYYKVNILRRRDAKTIKFVSALTVEAEMVFDRNNAKTLANIPVD